MKRTRAKPVKLLTISNGRVVGYLIPFGANNADKMRSFSICVLLKDEIGRMASNSWKRWGPGCVK